MGDIQKQEGFSYWKRPWHQWLFLAVGILQLLALWSNVGEYSRISAAAARGAFDSWPDFWPEYMAGKIQMCANNAIMALCFLGAFLIGRRVRSKKAAQKAEGILFLLLALVTGAVLWGCSLSPTGVRVLFWVCIMLVCLGGAAHRFWKYRK